MKIALVIVLILVVVTPAAPAVVVTARADPEAVEYGATYAIRGEVVNGQTPVATTVILNAVTADAQTGPCGHNDNTDGEYGFMRTAGEIYPPVLRFRVTAAGAYADVAVRVCQGQWVKVTDAWTGIGVQLWSYTCFAIPGACATSARELILMPSIPNWRRCPLADASQQRRDNRDDGTQITLRHRCWPGTWLSHGQLLRDVAVGPEERGAGDTKQRSVRGDAERVSRRRHEYGELREWRLWPRSGSGCVWCRDTVRSAAVALSTCGVKHDPASGSQTIELTDTSLFTAGGSQRATAFAPPAPPMRLARDRISDVHRQCRGEHPRTALPTISAMIQMRELIMH